MQANQILSKPHSAAIVTSWYRDPIRAISTITAALVAALALLAFILSYSALQHMAISNGAAGWLSYLWPLLLDFAMIVFSLAILRNNLRQESAMYPWVLTIAFASLATAANVMDAVTLGLPPAVIQACVKALAPIALVLAFELLMQMVKAEVKRSSVVTALADLTGKKSQLEAHIDKLTARRDRLDEQLADLKHEKRSHYVTIGDDTREQAMTILAERSNISGAELGRRLGRSDSTGRKLRRELLPLVTENGKG